MLMKNTPPHPPSWLSRWWQLWCCCFFLPPPCLSTLRFHLLLPPLCVTALPPFPCFPASCTLFAGILWQSSRNTAPLVRLLVGEAAAGDRARGWHDRGRQAEGVVKLLHHRQGDSSCSAGACYLRNCWCSLHRSVSCMFRTTTWSHDWQVLAVAPSCTVCCCSVHDRRRMRFSFIHFAVGLFHSPF